MRRAILTAILAVLIPFSCAFAHEIRFDRTEWDFGTVSNDDGTVFHTFEITNSSDQDFRIGGLVTSCSCVSAYIGRVSIKAGETVKLKVSIKAGGYGPKEYYVILFDTDERKVERVILKINHI